MSKTLLAALFLSVAATPAFADLVFTFNPNEVASPPEGLAVPGRCFNGIVPAQCIPFDGTITPDPNFDVLILDLQLSFTDPVATANFSLDSDWQLGPPFFPSLFSPGDGVYSGPMFDIDVNPAIPLGIYSGIAHFFTQADDPNATQMETLVPFQVDIVPEPTALPIVIAALAGLVGFRRRR